MMRGLAVAGPRPSQGVAAKIKNADIEDVSQLGAELLARPASGLGQRRLTHRNPDLRVTSIDQRGAPIPAVRGTDIERQGSVPKATFTNPPTREVIPHGKDELRFLRPMRCRRLALTPPSLLKFSNFERLPGRNLQTVMTKYCAPVWGVA